MVREGTDLPDFSHDLFTRLINHRVSDDRARREDYLTECLAWVLSNDIPLLNALLAPAGPVFAGHEYLAPILEATCEVNTQVHLSASDRPDLRIQTPGFVLLFECKVDAPYDQSQLERYLAHVQDVPRGGVIALVPRRSLPSAGQTPTDDRFLGVLTWEELAVLLGALDPTADARDAFRAALLALLDNYGLVPFDGKVAPWENPDGTQDSQQVRSICSVLNAAAADVGADVDLLSVAPDPYRASMVKTVAMVSGSGATPRPILAHETALRSCFEPGSRYRYHAFLDAVVRVNFQSAPTQGGPDAAVEFLVDTRPVVRASGSVISHWNDYDLFLRTVLTSGPWQLSGDADVSPGTGASADLQDGYETVVRQVGTLLAEEYPNARIEPWCQWGVRLVLCPTNEWVAVGAELSDLRTRHAQLLRSVFRALFEAEPDRPLGRLLTSTFCRPS